MAGQVTASSVSIARLLGLALLWLMQAALILLLINAEWLQGQAQDERTAMATHLGSAHYARLQQRAEDLYARWFVASGAMENSYAKLLPDKHRAKGDLNLAPWFFRWLSHRLDAFWWIVNQALYRALLLGEWGGYFAWVVAAACVDGLMQRRIKRAEHQSPSSDRYTLSRRALLLLLLLPLFYLSIPLSVAPALVPLWGGTLAFTLIVFTAHMQHRV